MPFYAVFVGKIPGIYTTWAAAKQNITNFPGAKYKSFSMKTDALAALTKHNDGVNVLPSTSTSASASASTSVDEGKIIIKHKNTLITLIDKYYANNIDFSILSIYTDGSVRNNGKKYATGSYGVFYSDPSILPLSKEIKKDESIINITTPLSELLGIIAALKNLDNPNYTKINLYTDSEYCYKALTVWYPKWSKNGWKTSGKSKTPGDVKNKIEIMEAYSLCRCYSVEIHHINSHTGRQGQHYIGNEIADMLTKCY